MRVIQSKSQKKENKFEKKAFQGNSMNSSKKLNLEAIRKIRKAMRSVLASHHYSIASGDFSDSLLLIFG